MTRQILGICIFVASCGASACEMERITCYLDELAASQNLEAVYGDRFPEINPYGSYGSPYVLDFINYGDVENSIFFLARRKNKLYKADSVRSSLDLARYYDYFWVFAVKYSDSEFEVKEVLADGVGLMGLSLYYGKLDINSKEFSYLKSGIKINGSELDRRKLSTAILVSGQSSTVILFFYNGDWIRYIEREW